jgi:hypothetical protein
MIIKKFKSFSNMRKLIILLALIVNCQLSIVNGQIWHDANQGGILFGQGWTSEIGSTYQRFPASAQSKVPSGVWNLSKNTAGLNVRFTTNAKTIYVKYTLTGSALSYHNMPVTLQSGVDLYWRQQGGQWHWVSQQKKFSFNGQNATYTYSDLSPASSDDGSDPEYMLYFPMYNGVSAMSVGVDQGCTFEYVSVPADDKPIVAYGTSICQGCSASRPGMAWTSIIGRELESNVINLGFSGSAFMESGVFDMLAELKQAKLFIIDAIPNIKSSPGSIVNSTLSGVKKLRAVSDAPILLVESFGNSDKVMSPSEDNIDSKGNAKLKEAFEEIEYEGIRNVFYLTEEEIGATEDAMIEGTHPNDIGMREYADAYIEKINYIIANPDTASGGEGLPIDTLVRETRHELKKWHFGSNPGETPETLKVKIDQLLTAAQEAIDSHSCDAQCEGLMADIRSTMEEIRTTRNPMEEGYYYIVSAFDGFYDTKGYEMAMYTKGTALNWAKLDSLSTAYIYKITEQADGNWAIQNCATATYINTAGNGQSLTMSNKLLTNQVITPETDWSARFRICNTANSLPYIPNSNYFGSADGADVFNMSTSSYSATDPTSQAYGWYTWYLRAVTDTDVLDEILRTMKTEETIELEAAIAEAEEVIDLAMALQADENTKLITEANDNDPAHCQFSSNAKMPENTRVWGYYRNLLDGDRSTFFITIHDRTYGEPTEPHYLQVDLRDNPVDAFIFRYGRSSSWPTFSWKDVTVLASNDGEQWTEITELSGLPSSDTYDSPIIKLGKTYRHLRFSVNATEGNLKIGAGPAFAIGEFQMYPVVSADDAPFLTNTTVNIKTRALQTAMIEAAQIVEANTATADYIALFRRVTKDVVDAINGETSESIALDSLITAAEQAYLLAYGDDAVADDSQKLVTEADDNDPEHCQYFCNCPYPNNKYANLIDGNLNSYFFSLHNKNHGTPPEGYHFLQVDLKGNAADAIVFRYGRNPSWPTFPWKTVDVYASNDSVNWNYIERLTNLPTGTDVTYYDSKAIIMWQTYRYVRFEVAETASNSPIIGGGPAFCIGEFQVYRAKPSATAPYTAVTGVAQAADALYAALPQARAKRQDKTATADDVSQIRLLLDNLNNLLNN